MDIKEKLKDVATVTEDEDGKLSIIFNDEIPLSAQRLLLEAVEIKIEE